ncbi:MAG: DNA-directed RNA polymerase subunit beta' [Candidatus Brocadiae bacterium]|nr:DNA-directed RNA polymerase subunit beta' [Candidatus Brocadiia bacterium]
MVEAFYDRINDYAAVTIKLASPKDIRNWSYGEVKKPETINYRTYRPEKDGLFCERIFGPERDWECYCGKYKGMKHKGIVCDRCGVKVIHSRVRRKRMGHINLASPVAHIWFFKAMPSRLSTILGMKVASLEKVIYFQEYVVIDPGKTSLKKYELLSEDKYRELQFQHGEKSFRAGMGAEAIKELLQSMNIPELLRELNTQYEKTGSKQKQKEIIKRLKLLKMIRESGNLAEWMILDVIPVIPPDLRPLILLDSGNFATSDLNDLYRRLINRNNRLKKLLDMNAPEVIIKNEKRMLQQSVDALFDNSRCRRPVLGTGNRPLKSLTDMIKGKQGRFRENLLGKRVDYSARSVIVVGPELKLHQCGLPKKIALELFQPFIIRKLKDLGYADTIKSARKMLERKDDRVWDILEEVIHEHPVLLNRAPTLHRMGIQAFEPILVEGNAIKIHPLVCTGFNADFDGDQMAVHLPLSIEAQVEASTLMLSINNIFSPANGQPIIAPNQDIVLGCYYLNKLKEGEPGEDMVFCSYDEVFHAHSHHKVTYHSRIWYNLGNVANVSPKPTEENVKGKFIRTTVGRVIFNGILHPSLPFYNLDLDKKNINKIIAECYNTVGRAATLKLLDDLKRLGFYSATIAGISFSKNDLIVPNQKEEIIAKAQEEANKHEKAFKEGEITDQERKNNIIDCWTYARDRVGKAMMETLKNARGSDGRSFNPVYLMADSGARGSQEQIRQLAGMRGLMAKPNGEIIETPIIANFREGLKVLEYFSSTHGARKGLADTALKTADAGYLTRKLADVAQNVVINEVDCGTISGISKGAIKQGDEVKVSLSDNIYGRVARDPIIDKQTGEIIVNENEVITREIARRIEALGYEKIRVRSPLTCQTPLGICSKCYGMDLSTGRLVEEGMAVGIIAAQSIGEPGTQLTMRTFHIGGIAMKKREEPLIKLPYKGSRSYIKFHNMNIVKNKESKSVVIGRNGFITLRNEEIVELPKDTQIKVVIGQQVVPGTTSEILAAKGKKETKAKMSGTIKEIEGELDSKRIATSKCKITIVNEENINIPMGAILNKIESTGKVIEDGSILENLSGEIIIATRDPHTTPIFSEYEGYVRYDEIIPNVTMRQESKGKIIMEHKGEKHPAIVIQGTKGEILRHYPLPERSHIEVEDGTHVSPGTLLAKIPMAISGTQDITGGLPRVTEILEARRPKNPSVISEIDGIVTLGDKRRGKRTVVVENAETKTKKEHLVLYGKDLRVATGDRVKAGDALIDGPKVPHDILRCCGPQALQNYLMEEIQSVYRSQNVKIDDKHIEIIISQMMRKVKVDKPGDTEFLPGSVVDKFYFNHINEKVRSEGKKPASYKPLLLGITKASLQSDSFISAASFQETTKVLTEAALAGKKDNLLGLKENVILGHMVPAGTGFRKHSKTKLIMKDIEIPDKATTEKKAEEEPAEDPSAFQKAKPEKAKDSFSDNFHP